MRAGGHSHVGRVRARNEDAMGWDTTRGVALVADGMGGHPCGDVAAQLAVDAALQAVRREAGDRAWLDAGGEPESGEPLADPCESADIGHFHGWVDIDGVRDLQAGGACLLDVREARRYEGLEEPIDPVAGHIPGALNRPWQGLTDDRGRLLPPAALKAYLGDLPENGELVVYCGSGVTACAGLFALSVAGRETALLYPGSWSDWCSYL